MLPTGIEPLELADGTKINPIDGTVIPIEKQVMVEVPNYKDMQSLEVTRRKRLDELPLPPEKMNTLSIVMCYSLCGIDDSEIAGVLGITTEQLGKIKLSEAYNTVYNDVLESIRESSIDSVRDYLEQNSNRAAKVMVESLNSESESNRMAASRDILDRTGHRPADRVEHYHKHEGGLTIEYVDKTSEEDIPTIDITPTEI